jgi:hypothetical protein
MLPVAIRAMSAGKKQSMLVREAFVFNNPWVLLWMHVGRYGYDLCEKQLFLSVLIVVILHVYLTE